MLKRAFGGVCLGSLVFAAYACSANGSSTPSRVGSGGSGNTGNTGNNSGGTGNINTGSGGTINVNPGGGSSSMNQENPESCADAANGKTYVGCDFWPTVVYNPVYNVFDFAAVVANAGTQPAMVTVTRGSTMQTATVMPGSLQEIRLPWVPELKGAAFNQITQGARPTKSVRVDGGAYHLVSTVPVTVWQFNPVEYKKTAAELATEMRTCDYPPSMSNGDGVDCESVSADAALLIPSTALTGNYRVSSKSAFPIGITDGTGVSDSAGGFSITATANATHVKIQLSDDMAGGTGVTAAKKGDIVEYDMNAGDVLELLSQPAPFAGMAHSDLSGSIVNANLPVQLIGFNPLTTVPSQAVPPPGSCCADHLEETVLPAEVLGKHYVVTPPSTHTGKNSGHYVRFMGDFDGTTLTYKGTAPADAPATLSAGQIVEVDASGSFEVTATQPFSITSTMKSGTVQNGCTSGADCAIGDPSMTDEVAVEQFRTQYIFLAPSDFDFNWVDVVAPVGAMVKLDDAAIGGTMETVDDAYVLYRVQLMAGSNMGAHKIVADQPIGIQVMGYGHATSYYYPGGLNLNFIADVPVVK